MADSKRAAYRCRTQVKRLQDLGTNLNDTRKQNWLSGVLMLVAAVIVLITVML